MGVAVYLAGSSRSGTSIVGSVLGARPRHVFIGELRFLARRGLTGQWPCQCGEAVKDCEFWSQVLDRAGTDGISPDAELAAVSMRRSALVAPYLHALRRMHSAAAEVADADVVIDSSKHPVLARRLPHVCVVQVIRDARAVVYSSQRRAFGSANHGALYSAASWALWEAYTNRIADATIHYESFVADHRGETVDLAEQHAFSANKALREYTVTTVDIDDSWRAALAPTTSFAVTAIAARGLLRHGYQLGVHR